jgi:poly-gamma-glutamate capsule biosynthesis protein CapA/YwtB (metallophosphatase superfamily)
MKDAMRFILGGDAMLGRLVKEKIGRFGPEYPLGKIAATMKQADLRLVNLECEITSSEKRWSGAPKAFYFGAPPEAVQTLVGAGADLVSLPNNHTPDYGKEGLLETIRFLRSHGIGFAEAGTNAKEARAPFFIERNGIKFGMVVYCDHQEDFAAGEARPGISCLDLLDEEESLDQIHEDLDRMRKMQIDWPILSLHWGPNMARRPSDRIVRFAHAAIDYGYGFLFGHSAHVFHGIEIYRDRPIFYSAGDLVDDYYVDPDFKNDHQLLFELELSRTELRRIDLHPIFIEDCRTAPAIDDQFEYIARQINELCTEMGTKVQREGDRIWIDGR